MLDVSMNIAYFLTPWSRVLLEKLSWSRNPLHFMEPEGSLPHLQMPSTDPVLSQIR
jgi:hypothetical protein